MSEGITGPKSVILKTTSGKNAEDIDSTNNRLIHIQLIKDNNALWDVLDTDFEFKLKAKARKAKSPACGMYVLEAVRRKGRRAKKSFTSQQFNLVFKSREEAIKTENTMVFGDALLTKLEYSRKRHRGTTDCASSSCDNGSKSKRKKTKHADLAKRLCSRAASNGVEREMYIATNGYTDFRCVGNLTKRGTISNFIRSLKKQKLKSDKRDASDNTMRSCRGTPKKSPNDLAGSKRNPKAQNFREIK